MAIVALYRMHSQLKSCNEAWMCKSLPPNTLPAWQVFLGSTVLSEDKEHFFGALKFTTLKQQATKLQHNNHNSNKWKNSLSLSLAPGQGGYKGKKPYFKTSNQGQGAGNCTTQD